MQMTSDLPLISRGIYPSLPSLLSPDPDTRGIFSVILLDLNPLILQPTAWLSKETIIVLNQSNIPVITPSAVSIPVPLVMQSLSPVLGSHALVLAFVQVQEERINQSPAL